MSDPTIQSPAGPAADATGVWRVSLSEIDAMCRKAARGAGFPWGLAEEAGRAARWLAAHGEPGPEALLAALAAMDGAVADHAPRPGSDPWSSAAGTLCAVTAGAALSDRAADLAAGVEIALGPIRSPLLLAPFLCRAARDQDCALALVGGSILFSATPFGPTGPDPANSGLSTLRVARCDGLRAARTEASEGRPLRPRAEAWTLTVETWRALDRFAARTYAPATEASRRSGAGADDASGDRE